jgi:hypothetical protein
MPISGKHTYGLDRFYNSKPGKAEKGLEISTLALVDVTDNTAYNLSTVRHRNSTIRGNAG